MLYPIKMLRPLKKSHSREKLTATVHDFSHIHGDVLQRVVRQVLHAAAVWLLSVMGAQLGIQEEGHYGRDTKLCS